MGKCRTMKKPLRVFGTVLVLVLATTTFAQNPSPAATQSTDVSRLPPEVFLARPKYRDMQVSPDGKFLAAVVPLNERGNLALIDLEKGTAKMLTGMKNHDVGGYSWIGDRLLEIEAWDMTEASGVGQRGEHVLVDTDGNLVRDMQTSGPRGASTIIETLDRAGYDLVVVNHDRTIDGLDAYRYNPKTSEKSLLTFQSPGFVKQFVADHDGQVRIAVSIPYGGKTASLWYRKSNDSEWKKLRETLIDRIEIQPIAFAFDNATLYVYARAGAEGGRRGVYEFDPETNLLGKQVFRSTEFDAGRLIFDRVQKKLVGIVDGSRDSVKWIDPEFDRLQQSINAAIPGARNRIGWGDYDTDRILVVTDSETRAPIFSILDRKNLKLDEVAVAFPQLASVPLAPRKRVNYSARDGLNIPAYLTIPRGLSKNLPLVIDIHGGPFIGGGQFGYDGRAQFFASRGYAVLQPDFRGTRGYGEAFYRAGWRQWGLAMQDDVTDGAKWLIANGTVDPDRVCLFGGSYGGYATLWGLEKEPDMFRCGVAYIAVSDLDLLFTASWSDTNQMDRDGSIKEWQIRHIGDPDKDKEKLRAVSPLYHADRIKAPLLLAYGASDRRVPMTHGNQMRSALDKYNKSYEWVVYPDEGHGFNKDEHKYDFYRRVDAFLAKHLAPRTKTASAAPPATSR